MVACGFYTFTSTTLFLHVENCTNFMLTTALRLRYIIDKERSHRHLSFRVASSPLLPSWGDLGVFQEGAGHLI